MKNKIKTWGVMLKFMPPNESVEISPNRKDVLLLLKQKMAPWSCVCVCVCLCVCVSVSVCVCLCDRERDHCFVHKYYEALNKFHISSSILTML